MLSLKRNASKCFHIKEKFCTLFFVSALIIVNTTCSYSHNLKFLEKVFFSHPTVDLMPSLKSKADFTSNLLKSDIGMRYYNAILEKSQKSSTRKRFKMLSLRIFLNILNFEQL